MTTAEYYLFLCLLVGTGAGGITQRLLEKTGYGYGIVNLGAAAAAIVAFGIALCVAEMAFRRTRPQ